MIEMTLSSRHRIRNSSPGGLRPSTLPLGHGGSTQYWLSHVDGEETFLFLSNRRDREPNPGLWCEGSGANHYPRAPAHIQKWKRKEQNINPITTYCISCHFYISANEYMGISRNWTLSWKITNTSCQQIQAAMCWSKAKPPAATMAQH